MQPSAAGLLWSPRVKDKSRPHYSDLANSKGVLVQTASLSVCFHIKQHRRDTSWLPAVQNAHSKPIRGSQEEDGRGIILTDR